MDEKEQNMADEETEHPESCWARFRRRFFPCCRCCDSPDSSTESTSEDSYEEDEEEQRPEPPNDNWRKDDYNPLTPNEKAAVRANRLYKAQQEGTYVSTFAHRKAPGAPPRTPTQSHVLDVSPSPTAMSKGSNDSDNERPLLRRNSSIRFTEVMVAEILPGEHPSEAQLSASDTPGSIDQHGYTVPTNLLFSPSTPLA